MAQRTDDLRIQNLRPLLPPAILMEEHAASVEETAVVVRGREEVTRILKNEDDRLLVVVGPCSIHDPRAALEYASRLAEVAHQHRDDLCIVMRVYFEKPRTTIGWKGLINDPHLDGSFAINEGLRAARRFLLDILALDRQSGAVLWQRTAREEPPHEGTHQDGSWAPASPVTDGERVYAHFGSRGLYCYDMAAEPPSSRSRRSLSKREPLAT